MSILRANVELGHAAYRVAAKERNAASHVVYTTAEYPYNVFHQSGGHVCRFWG
jgi:hypothetical protein